MAKYDYLIVGAGLYGAVCARELTDKGYKVLVLERRPHIAGNIYTEKIEGINVHRYGAHIFHTSDKKVWDYMGRFATFNNFVNSPIARYRGECYNMPFNMNTFTKIWPDVFTPDEAKRKIDEERKKERVETPRNLEEQAVNLVGRTIYEKLVKEYTEKQWGRDCKDLPASIIKRLPVRFTFDNNYFDDRYQGIPEGGYTAMVERMLEGIEVRLNTDFLKDKKKWMAEAELVIYTGCIDEFYGYMYGPLEYRSVRFETEVLDTDNFQGNAVVNYTSHEEPYTRIIEHKHFEFANTPKTVISREYSSEWKAGDEPYYPLNDSRNDELYTKYVEKSMDDENVYFGGRLGKYRYYDMDDVVSDALDLLSGIPSKV